MKVGFSSQAPAPGIIALVERFDVAVLGAGPAGLMAALTAVRAGRSVVTVERSQLVGGLAACIEVGGQRVDFGSHRLHRSIAPDLLGDLRSLLGDELQASTAWRPDPAR